MKTTLAVAALSLCLASCGSQTNAGVAGRRTEVAQQEAESFIIEYLRVNTGTHKIYINSSDYLSYKRKNHFILKPEDYTSYVTYNDPTIKQIAGVFVKSYPREELGQKILNYVRTFTYDQHSERLNRDYVRYPVETIVERNGDCEDAAILASSIMKAAGLDVALLWFPGNPEGHLAVGVSGKYRGASWERNDVNYFYGEATGEDWPGPRQQWDIGDARSHSKDRALIYSIR